MGEEPREAGGRVGLQEARRLGCCQLPEGPSHCCECQWLRLGVEVLF